MEQEREMMTRARLLAALRRVIPGASARRLGDLIDAGTLQSVALQQNLDMSMAFGTVLLGNLTIHLGGEPVFTARAGETFGLARYALDGKNIDCKATTAAANTQVLTFSHEIVTALGLASPISTAFAPQGKNSNVRNPIHPM